MRNTGLVGLRRRLGVATTAVLGAALAAPALADAHGFAGRADLAIPRWLFAWGAFVVLVVSFVGLATLWPKPRLEHAKEREVLSVPKLFEPLLGALGVFLFFVTIYAGFKGTQSPNANFAPTFIFIVFWVGTAFASILFGDLFRVLNPWRALGRSVGWFVAKAGSTPEPVAYPEWLGRWPAALSLLSFTILELVIPETTHLDPSTLATYALVYAAIQLVGMSVFGTQQWTDNADGFAVYFNILSRLSPWDWHDSKLSIRPLLSGVTDLTRQAGTVPVLIVLIGTTSFDGFSQGPTWRSLGPHVQKGFEDLGMNVGDGLTWATFVGLLFMVGVIATLYRLGVLGIRSVDQRYSTPELQRRFVHSLAPIALAYVVAHYFSYLLINGQGIAYLASDPLGDGANIFGTASATIHSAWLSNNMVWYVQVGALILGHVGGLCLAHDRALTMYTNVRVATRSQYWMLAVMVAFTSLGLWLLSAQGT